MKSKKLKNWLLLVVVAILLIIADKQGYFNWLKRPVGKLVNPVKHSLYLNKVTEGNPNVVEAGELAITKAELVKKSAENERLRKLLETKLPPSWRFVPANILGLSGDQMTIDVGEALEVEKEMMVMALVEEKINGGVVIGRIDKVELMKSTVKLITDQDVMIRVKTESEVEGVVRSLKRELLLSEVLQNSTLQTGELILTEGRDGWLPGLVVGRVGQVSKVDTEVYQSAKVESIIENSSLKQVYIVSL